MTSELQRLMPGADARIESMAEAVAVAVMPAQVGAAVTGTFGLIAVALAACGVYGLVSFGVIQRTRELAIRRAIGATAADIVRLVIGQHAAPIAVGLVIGVTAGVLGARLLTVFLAGVRPTDLRGAGRRDRARRGLGAHGQRLPARRATRVDPMVALRDA